VKGSSALRCPTRVIPIRSVLCQGQEPEPRSVLAKNGSFGVVEFFACAAAGRGARGGT